MSRSRQAWLGVLAGALVAPLAWAEPLQGSVPLPPPKPPVAAVAPPEDDPGAVAAPGGEAEPTGAALPPALLLADPALASDLGALLAGPTATQPAPRTDDAEAAGVPAVAGEGLEPTGNAQAVAVEVDPVPAGPGQGGEGQEAAAGVPQFDAPLASDAILPMQPMQPVPPALVWDDRPLDATGAARLFEIACLGTLPHFIGVGAFFDRLGFITVPGMRIRNHPQKHVSALATTPADVMESGVRSCAILVDGLDQAQASSAVRVLVAERFGDAQRFETPAKGIAHEVWIIDTAIGPAKITVTQSGGSSFIGATVLPPVPGVPPQAEAQIDGG